MFKRHAIFLDRDGVINVNRSDYVKSWDEFAFLPRVLDALRLIPATGFLSIITTNQAAINRGLVTETTVRDIHTRMLEAIHRAGGCIDAVYFCPHRPEDECNCRKPRPGMYLQAAREFNVDLARSYVIGDTVRDAEAARAIGARPILVLSGEGCNRRNGHACGDCTTGCIVAADLSQAIEWICENERARS